MLEYAVSARSKFIIRSSWDRCIESNSPRKSRRHLVKELHDAPHLGSFTLPISAQKGRAALMASVAARIQHIKASYHESPTDLAANLFSAAELKGIQLLRFHTKEDMPADTTVEQAIVWLARVGGYIGPSNGAPGQETIGRGLMRVQIAVDVLVSMGWTHEIPPF